MILSTGKKNLCTFTRENTNKPKKHNQVAEQQAIEANREAPSNKNEKDQNKYSISSLYLCNLPSPLVPKLSAQSFCPLLPTYHSTKQHKNAEKQKDRQSNESKQTDRKFTDVKRNKMKKSSTLGWQHTFITNASPPGPMLFVPPEIIYLPSLVCIAPAIPSWSLPP